MTTITARELNYMIYRYLHESGFGHSAFIMRYEAGIDQETIDPNSVPAGSLVTCVQKGIQYLELEANMKIDDADLTEDFTFVKPFDLLNMNVDEIKKSIEQQREFNAAQELANLRKGKGIEDRALVVMDKQKEKIHDVVNYKRKKSVAFGGPEPMDASTSSTPRLRGRPRGVRSSDVLVLEGHSDEVFACAWSPTDLVLASGSGDSTARIWRIADRTNSTSVVNRLAGVRVLRHSEADEDGKIITALDWNLDGTFLATGSYDGSASIWHTHGELKSMLIKHNGPIYSIKWNKRGNYVLTGGYDQSSCVWDVNANGLMQQFEFHSGPVLDVDWRTNHTFASGSSDAMIYVCKIGHNEPLKIFSGHKDEVNCILWDPTGSILASASDDTTAKIWSMKHEMPVLDFTDHTEEVYTLEWSPTGPTTDNPNMPLLLASASFDSTVKLWDVDSGRLYRSLNGHRLAVYCLSFSPNGEYLASGSDDSLVHIWSVKDGKIVKTFFCKGCVSGVSWNKDGNKIAYSTHKHNVCISDFRM